MKLRHDSAWTRIYLFSSRLIRRFGGDRDRVPYVRRTTDLCRFVRTVFLWAPLVAVVQIATVQAVGFTVLYLPITLFGWEYGKLWVWIAAGLIGVTVGVWASYGFVKLFERYPMKVSWFKVPRLKVPPFVKETQGLIVLWYRGFKERFCPIIELGEEQ